MTKKTKDDRSSSKVIIQRLNDGVKLEYKRVRNQATKITSEIKPPDRPKKK